MSSTQQPAAASWEDNIRDSSDYLVGPRPAWWRTGRVPDAAAPGVCPSTGQIRSIKSPNLASCTRGELQAFFDNSWGLTEVLLSGLKSEEAFYRPPYHHLRHPLIFYYGHPASVYVNKLRVAGLMQDPIDPYFEAIFETGVDEMKWDDMSKNAKMWPSLQEVAEYRGEVYKAVSNIIQEHPAFETTSQLQNSPFWAVVLGCDHERIHLETSSVLIRELPIELVQRPEQWPDLAPRNYSENRPSAHPKVGIDYPLNDMVHFGPGSVRLGKPADFPSFGWDNEYGERVMDVAPFSASKYLISNGEFYEFVASGNYMKKEFWGSKGWQWRSFRNSRKPTFWVTQGPNGLHQYKLRTVFEEIDMPWSWPACVNYYEAEAFALWKSKTHDRSIRITTEAEHNIMREATTTDTSLGAQRDPTMVHDGLGMHGIGQNLNMAFGSESPVDLYPANSKGLHDVFGNAWHWCEDHFCALPGFKVHPHYEDFSLPCFDGEHNIILGGSFMSTGDEASIFARFHFRPHFFQHASFRLVESQSPLITTCMDNEGPYAGSNPFRTSPVSKDEAHKYEDREVLRQYLQLHFGGADQHPEYVPRDMIDFPRRCSELVAKYATETGIPRRRALDIGCAVGGSTFELARHFEEVVGIELAEAFVATAKSLQATGSMSYEIRTEGELSRKCVATVPQDVDLSRVTFQLGDATDIDPQIGQFDAVLIANVICRLQTPKDCLARLGGSNALVRPGGIVVLTTPWSWKESFTSPSKWLGGRKDSSGKGTYSTTQLKAFMADEWELLHEEPMPMVIQEHARKFELVYPLATVWRRKV